jgi:ABC-2 type transport system ATP-binding protein
VLSEISQTCDRLLVIQAGEIVAQGSEAELAARMGATGTTISIDARTTAELAKVAIAPVAGVGKLEFLPTPDGQVVTISCEADVQLTPKLVRALVAADIDVLRVDQSSAPQLENIFLRLTKTTAPSEAKS